MTPVIGWGDYILADPWIGVMLIAAVAIAIWMLREIDALRRRRDVRRELTTAHTALRPLPFLTRDTSSLDDDLRSSLSRPITDKEIA